jgi:hypothetical protein
MRPTHGISAEGPSGLPELLLAIKRRRAAKRLKIFAVS